MLDRTTAGFLGRCLLAAVCILPVGLLFREAPLVLQVVIGVVTYGLASLALRTTSAGQVRDGIQRAREMVASRGRARRRPTVTSRPTR